MQSVTSIAFNVNTHTKSIVMVSFTIVTICFTTVLVSCTMCPNALLQTHRDNLEEHWYQTQWENVSGQYRTVFQQRQQKSQGATRQWLWVQQQALIPTPPKIPQNDETRIIAWYFNYLCWIAAELSLWSPYWPSWSRQVLRHKKKIKTIQTALQGC